MFENINKEGFNPQEGNQFSKLPAGGYVCVIKEVFATKDAKGRDKMNVEFDICEGEYKGYYEQMKKQFNTERRGVYSFYPEYQGDISNELNRFAGAVEATNEGFKSKVIFEKGGEKKFVNKGVGFIIGEEKYTNNAGEDKTTMKVFFARSVKSIREGNFKVPEPRDRRVSIPTATTATSNPFISEPPASNPFIEETDSLSF